MRTDHWDKNNFRVIVKRRNQINRALNKGTRSSLGFNQKNNMSSAAGSASSESRVLAGENSTANADIYGGWAWKDL